MSSPPESDHVNTEMNELTIHFTIGDGLAGYICIAPDGEISAWLNKGPKGWVSVSKIKNTEGKDRSNIRFADINGDVRARRL